MKRGWVCGELQAALFVGCAPVDEEEFTLEDVLPQALAAEPNICPGGDVHATPVAPNILFLLDKSSSMAGLDPRNHLKNR